MTGPDENLPFGPLGTPIIRCIGETLGRGLETMVRALMPDHEPGPDCPNVPHTCLICQPKVEAEAARFASHDQDTP